MITIIYGRVYIWRAKALIYTDAAYAVLGRYYNYCDFFSNFFFLFIETSSFTTMITNNNAGHDGISAVYRNHYCAYESGAMVCAELPRAITYRFLFFIYFFWFDDQYYYYRFHYNIKAYRFRLKSINRMKVE